MASRTSLIDDHRDRIPQHSAFAAPERTERLLARAAQAQTQPECRRLQQEAVILNLPLADGISHRYAGRGLEWDDLCQVGRFALVKAVRRYRPGAPAGFAAFATPTIAGEIKRHFRDRGWAVRPPRRIQELRGRLPEAEALLVHRLMRQPTSSELADALGVTQCELAEARLAGSGFSPQSLDASGQGSVDLPLGELLADGSDDFAVAERNDLLRASMAHLCARDRLIVRLRFVEELTQAEIGEQIGVSQMHVSRLLTRVLARLHDDLTEDFAEACDDVG